MLADRAEAYRSPLQQRGRDSLGYERRAPASFSASPEPLPGRAGIRRAARPESRGHMEVRTCGREGPETPADTNLSHSTMVLTHEAAYYESTLGGHFLPPQHPPPVTRSL